MITGPGGTVKEVFDFVFARKGRAELSLALFNVDEPFPTDLAVQLTNAMTDRTPGV